MCEVLVIWAVAALAGCSTEAAANAKPAELAEIWALLHDPPLPELDATPSVIALSRPPSLSPIGHWRFDDCDAGRVELANASDGQLDAAYRSAGVRCSAGVLGRAVELAAREAIVYVPDQPYFGFGGGVTLAAWFRPSGVDRTQTLFRKRSGGGSAFALVIQGGRFRFAIDLGDGRATSVASPEPARPGVFQHVAASYDGRALRLYVDGREVATRAVAGAIAPGPGPLLIGNDGAERRFDGVVDDAVFDLRALTAQQVLELTCIPVAPRVVATPSTTAPTVPDAPVAFDIAVTNRNPPACAAMDFALEARSVERGLTLDPSPVFQERPVVPSGTTAHFGFTATPFDAVDAGSFAIGFDVFSLGWGFAFSGAVHLGVAAPAGCHVTKARELMITDLSVVQDPARTGDGGAWSFAHLAEQAAASRDDAPAMIEDLLRSYTAPQRIGGATLLARPGMNRFLGAWPRGSDGRLDLARAPLELQAIVNRIDLRDLSAGHAGRASFIFAFVEDGFQLPATLRFDYELPAASEADVWAWAQAFHALGSLAFSEPYNAALEAITEAFVRRGARPGAVNDSALRAVLSSETVFGSGPQMRTFALSPATGRLVPTALAAAGGRSPAVDTCGGCHSVAETGTAFQHIVPRFSRGEVSLSPFLRGDLRRRADDLAALVCPTARAPRASLGRGLRRTH